MSSRKKSQENSDSCRNLDGRRLRTVKEAKALAEYLEVKPGLEKEERERRMERWRGVVEGAEKREEGEGRRRFEDVLWVEGVEEGRERTREAVREALMEEEEEEEEEEENSSGEGSSGGEAPRVRRFAGWEEEEDEESSEDEEMEEVEGKGKAVVK